MEDMFVHHLTIKGLSGETISSYKSSLRSFARYFELTEINIQNIEEWQYKMSQEVSQVTLWTYTVGMRAFVRYLNKYHDYDIDLDLILTPRRPETSREYVSKPEVVEFLEHATCLRDEVMVRLLFCSGMRVSEMTALDIADIKDQSASVNGKGGKVRRCFFSLETMEKLEEYLDTRNDDNPALFVGKFGARLTPNVVRMRFQIMSDKSGIKITPHILRHSFATHMLKQGASTRHIQRFLGHAKLSTTEVYTHLVDNDLEAAYKRFMTT